MYMCTKSTVYTILWKPLLVLVTKYDVRNG